MIRKFYNYYLSEDKNLAKKLKSILGFTPTRISLYKLAFYHKSMLSNNPSTFYNNERLEYLGDAILSTIVAEYLFKKYPNKNEGFLTKMRSKIVKRKTLNDIASEMGLDVILSNYIQGKMSKSMMGNAFEALIGAIYLESGYGKTKRYVINEILRKHIDIHQLESLDDNYKSRLLEYCQKHNHSIEYKLISKYKFDKRDRFKVGVYLNGEEIAIAEDFNKKSAEQSASETALGQIELPKVEN